MKKILDAAVVAALLLTSIPDLPSRQPAAPAAQAEPVSHGDRPC